MRKAIIFLCLCGVYQMIYAQSTPLFHSVDLSINNLSGQQLEFYSKIVADDYFEEIHFIEFEDLGLVQSEGKILITIPNTQLCPSVKYYAKQVEYSSNSNYKWVGDVYSNCDTCFCSEGNFTLIKDTSGIYGHLSLDGEDYQIRDLGEGVCILVKYNYEYAIDHRCGLNEMEFEQTAQSGEDPPKTNPGNCKVKLLVLYDETANQQDPNILQTISLAVSELKTSLLNSAINTYHLNIEHVGTELFSLPSVNPNFPVTDLNVLALNLTVSNLRNTYNADLVVLVTGTNYDNINGIARMDDVNDALDFALIKEHGFAIVERGAQILGQFTFAHEVGHLFAAGHQNSSQSPFHPLPDSRPGIPHGHWITIGKILPGIGVQKRYTIMHTLNDGNIRVMHYSNPAIQFLGKSTGMQGIRNNALKIYNGACTVANYLPDTENATVLINGNNWACIEQSECVNAVIWGISPPYSFEWSTSTDGVNWVVQPSNNSNLCIIMPPNNGDRIYIKLSVTSGNTTITQFHEIEATTGGQNGIACALRLANPNHSPFFTPFYPNPNDKGIFYTDLVSSNEAYDIKIIIKDLAGRTIKNALFSNAKGLGEKRELNLTDLSSGIYVLTSVSNGESFSQKIVINQ